MIEKIHNPTLLKTSLKLLVFICLCIYNSTSMLAQNSLDFRLRLTIEDGNYDNTKIAITKNGSPFRVVDSRSKYDLELDLGVEYQITASKMGYITKSIIVNTKIPSGREDDEFGKFQSEITLKPQPSEDVEITYTQPVGRIEYSYKLGDFDFDKDYSAKAQEMQKKAEAAPRKRKKIENDSIASNPEIIEKTAELTPDPNKPKQKLTPPQPPLPPSVRNVEERFAQQDRLKITYRTVTINGVSIVYRREEYSWGGVYFYRDSKNITESTFETDTK